MQKQTPLYNPFIGSGFHYVKLLLLCLFGNNMMNHPRFLWVLKMTFLELRSIPILAIKGECGVNDITIYTTDI